MSIESAYACNSDTLKLLEGNTIEEIEIKEISDPFSEYYSQRIESLNAILLRQSSVNIKSYYNGGLATLSYRGTNAQQSQIYWNGLNINSPFLGLYDLNMLPNFQESASYSVDDFAIGRNYRLNDKAISSKKQVTLKFEVASFGAVNQSVMIGLNNRVNQSLKLTFRKADNNYSFVSNSETKKLQNGAYDFKDINYSVSGLSNKISFKCWIQDYYREVPFATPGAYQKDMNIRNVLNYNISTDHLSFNNSLAFFRETIEYNNDFSWLNAYLFKTEINLKSALKSFNFEELSIIPSYRVNQAHTPYYIKQRFQYIGTLELKAEKNIGVNNKLSIRIKEQVNNLKFYLPEWQFKLNSFLFKKNKAQYLSHYLPEWQFKLNSFLFKKNKAQYLSHFSYNLVSAHNIRIPTLNDMFWQPLGNPDLLPESAFSNEINLLYQYGDFRRTNKLFKLSGAIFHKRINNYIQWRPQFGGHWQPENVKSVGIFGFEPKFEFKILKSDFQFELNTSTSFTNAQNIVSDIPNDKSLNKQLIYVPRWKSNLNYSIMFKDTKLNFFYLKQSHQYTNTSNTMQTDGFSLINLSAEQKIHLDELDIDFVFSINNLFNKQYELYANRPSPLRNYAFTLKFYFNEKN